MIASNFTDRMLVQENGGGYYGRMSPVIEAVTVEDESTILITFGEPSPQILGVLATIPIADPEGFIRSDGTVAAYNQSEQLISTGPFLFSDYVPDQGWVMPKFDGYRAADEVSLEAVEVSIFGDTSTMISALEAGEIDYAFNVPTDEAVRLQGDDRFEVHIPEGFSLMYVTYLNPSRNEALQDPRLRQAIDLVADRIGMNDAAFTGLGTPHTACFPESSIAFDSSLEVDPASDPEAAQALLDGVTLPTEPLVMPVPSTNPTLLAMTEILAANLEEIGIPVAIETMDQSAWAERLNTVDFDVLVSITGVVSEHPALQWDTRFFQPTGNALLEGVTDEYIEAYQEAYSEGLALSGSEAEAKWQEANQALKAGAWMHCLVAAPFVHVTSSNVEGFTWNNLGMPIFREVRIAE
jgi:peptide/nickel transport system substrate-binding protein